jgi:hypothetical protein
MKEQSSTPLDIDAILAELRKRKESPPSKQEMQAMLAELRWWMIGLQVPTWLGIIGILIAIWIS